MTTLGRLGDMASTMAPSSDNKQIRLPNKNINSEYLMSIMFAIRDMDSIIKDIKRVDDPRPQFMARQIINRVLDDEIRYIMIDKFDAAIKKIEAGEGDDYVKGRAVIQLSQDIVGEVNSYLDEFFGLHKGQVIGDV